MTDEGLENTNACKNITQKQSSQEYYTCAWAYLQMKSQLLKCGAATTTSHVHMCVTFVLEQYCISNSTSKYHIYAYHSMFNFQYLNYVVHNSPLANQVSVPVSFWHPPELQYIYPIGCKLLTCCYRGCSCYGSVLWLL